MAKAYGNSELSKLRKAKAKTQKDIASVNESYYKKAGVYGSLASDAGAVFGDTSQLADDSDFNIGQGLQSAGLGISTFAALGGPIGIGVGVALGVGSFLFGKSKREKARKEAEKRWNKGLAKYKEQVKALKQNTEMKESQINKAIGQGAQFSLLEQARQDAATAQRLTEAQRGVKATTYESRVEAEADTAAAEVEIFDERLLSKLDILDEAQALAEKEITARRDVFGSYKTEFADQLQDKLAEFDKA